MNGRVMRSGFALAITLLVVVGLPSIGAAQQGAADGTAPDAGSSAVSLLGVAQAQHGTLDGHRLVLDGVDPHAVWFSDRPTRAAGSYSMPELITAFFDGQKPPNAAIEFAGTGAKNDVVLVELSDPRYRAHTHRLTASVRVLPKDPSSDLATDSALRAFADRHDGTYPRRFDAVTVFIDGAPACQGLQCSVQQLAAGYDVSLRPAVQDALVNMLKLVNDPATDGKCSATQIRTFSAELDGIAAGIFAIAPQIKTLESQGANPDAALLKKAQGEYDQFGPELTTFLANLKSCVSGQLQAAVATSVSFGADPCARSGRAPRRRAEARSRS
jgi:hypothetical protein